MCCRAERKAGQSLCVLTHSCLAISVTPGPSLLLSLYLNFLVYHMELIFVLYFPALKSFLKGLTKEGV